MPTVPGPSVLDFETGKVKLRQAASGSDGQMYAHKMFRQAEQSREISAAVPRPSETDIAIALATMHEHGKLFAPPPEPEVTK